MATSVVEVAKYLLQKSLVANMCVHVHLERRDNKVLLQKKGDTKEQKTAKEEKERIPTEEQASNESKWGGGEVAEDEEGDQETCSEAILDQPAV